MPLPDLAPVPDAPDPPDHLGEPGRALWINVLGEFALEDAHDLTRLEIACVAADRRSEAAEVLQNEGLTFLDRFDQPKEHPLVAVERQQAALQIRALRELGLDSRAIEAARPPKTRGYRP